MPTARATVPLLHWFLGIGMLVLSATFAAAGATQSPAVRSHKDVVYATVEGKPLALDLYVPARADAAPLLVWVHGGAWSQGTKANPPRHFVAHGIATASLDFRQSTDAVFPAQVHDIKAAIRD